MSPPRDRPAGTAPAQGSARILSGAAALITHPRRHAALLSLGYGLLGVGYILVSGRIAAALSSTKLQLYEIELLKGLGFVAVTAVLLFFMALSYLKRLEAREAEALHEREIAMAADRRAVAGLFAASVAHDINNVLTVNSMAIERLAGLATLPEESRRLVDTLEQTNRRLRELVQRLGRAGGDQPTGIRDLDLVALIRQAVDLARHHMKLKGCHIQLRLADRLHLRGDADLLHRMVLNLLLNAGDATRHRGQLLVVLCEEEGRALLEVHDNGPGIPPDQRERVFQPLYSTKPDGSGLGLLSVTHCARAHGGKATAVESELGGACFRVDLGRAVVVPASSAA